jgi:endonuclease/exonuclease/phosphatase family metal-dependent hydrolase
MPLYYHLRYKVKTKVQRKRAIENLLALRGQLDLDIPGKDMDNNLLLATWNIRDFGKTNRRGFGKRMPETWFYIAEVISRFDMVAVQEVNELDEWEEVMDILGPDWEYIASDVTDRALGGNGERLTFVYDKRKVGFQNIAGEIVLPAKMLISKVEIKNDKEKLSAGKQFRRTPYITSFQSGWFKFDICTVHLYYGDSYGKKLQQRVEEIGRIAAYLSDRADKALKDYKALILLGDFNIVSPEHKTMKALLDHGFLVPKGLQKRTNIKDTKYYDQIAFKTRPQVIDYIEKQSKKLNNRNAGVFDIFRNVFTPEQFATYKADAMASPQGKKQSNDADLRKYYMEWRSYQFSDHKPLWVRLNTNDSKVYLERLKAQN